MLIEITYNVTDVYMSTTETPVYVEISFEQPGGSAAVWGSITGTLSNQTDLQSALDLKLDESTIDGGTEGQILSKASATDFDFAWINNYAKYLATNVRNQTGSTINAFQVVYISGATGNKPLISLADADTEATSSKTYGVTATSIANNSTGDVVTAGELSGINTSAFNEGDLLWLSTTAGGVVTSPPAEPAHAVFIGTVIRSHPTLGVIDVAISNGYELTELHGVQITTPTDNQGLFYNSTSTLWENKSIATALGFTPANAATTLTINGVTYDLSANRSWTVAAGISGSGTATYLAKFTDTTTLGNSLLRENTNAIALGKSPSGWSLLNAFQVQNASLAGWSNNLYLYANAFYDGTNPRYINNGFSTYYEQNSTSGTHLWYIAPTGTAGNVISYTSAMSLNNLGRLILGAGSDFGTRLQVYGDTLLRGSGNTSATTALTVQNSSSTNLFRVRNDGYTTVQAVSSVANLQIGNFLINNITTSGITTFSMGARNSFFEVGFASGGYSWTFRNTSNILDTSGLINHFNLTATVAPTSGTLAFNLLNLNPTINQTGGANGITRGLYVNPTLTSAADFRAIETTAGNVLFGSGFFWDNANVRLGIGTNAPTEKIHINGNQRIGLSGSTGYYISWGQNEVGSTGDFARIQGIRTSGVGNQAGHLTFQTKEPSGGTTPTERLRITDTGNISIGTTSDLAVRLGVVGDTLLRGSGNTSATTALTVQNSDSTNLFRITNNGIATFGSTGSTNISSAELSTGAVSTGALSRAILFSTENGNGIGYQFYFRNSITGGNTFQTSGAHGAIQINSGFAPTSGTAQFNTLLIANTINQTGGANGITRGLYVNPTLTAAADFRAIETTAGNVLFGASFIWNNSTNLLRVNGGIGVNRDPTGGRAIDVTGGGIRLVGSVSGTYEVNGNNSSFTISTVGGIAGINIGDTNNAIINMTGNSYTYRILANASLLRIRDANAGDIDRFAIHSTGNIGIGFGSTDPAVRLGVSGDTLLRGSGATSATTALTVQNSSSSNLLRILNDGTHKIGGQNIDIYPTANGSTISNGGRGLIISTNALSQTDAGALKIIGGYSSALGSDYGIWVSHSFTNGTGGVAIHNGILLNQTINQTGGANGITRGLYVNPTLTSAADFRAIETTAGNVLFGSNFFWDNANGRLGIGTNAPAYRLHNVGTSAFDNGNSGDAVTILNNGFISMASTRFRAFSTSFIFQDSAYNTKVSLSMAGNISVFNTGGNYSFGTSSDLGVRLGVVGDTILRGSGATSATTALTVQNSSSTVLGRFRNDGAVTLGAGGWLTIGEGQRYLYKSLNLTSIFTIGNDSTVGATIDLYGSSHATNANRIFLNGSQVRITSASVLMTALPTSSAGLPTGALWNDAGTVKIV